MSVVAAHLYRNGKKAKAVSLDEPIDCKGKSEFVWIGLFEPTEKELQQLEKNYRLHPLAIEDALKANQIPKVDVYGDQLFVMLVCILAGVGTAGVPGGSLPVIALILAGVGVPPEGIGLILGVDRFLDMCRTTLNVVGDLVAAQVISALGAKDQLDAGST